MPDKLKVFVAHCFDKAPPAGEALGDVAVADWFVKLMRARPLSYHVVTETAKSSPERIDDKIKADIADCNCLVAIFTRRHYDEKNRKWFPSQFVLCEASSAIGFYYNTNKVICGFYEEGIDPHDLALVTIGGLELISFKRSELEKDKTKFQDYLKRIPSIVASGFYKDGEFVQWKLPYTQQTLRKIYTVYANGNVTVQNIGQVLIADTQRFLKERQGHIQHVIWQPNAKMPSIEAMLKNPVEKRREQPFLRAILRQVNQKRFNLPLGVTPKKTAGDRASFDVAFLDDAGRQMKLKNQDIVRYQYAWGIPKAYATSKDQLAEEAADITDAAYNQAEVTANHGLIHEMTLELRFERREGNLFSKSPFYQTTPSVMDPAQWSASQDMPLTQEEDHEMWFQTYRITERNFQGRLRVLWRPTNE
jgi:hypothetical protein